MSRPSATDDLQITPLASRAEAEQCASLMASSEPWLTLRRNYEYLLEVITDPAKEVYLARRADEFGGFIIINMKGAFIGYIQTLCLAPAWRNQGYGSQLIAFAEDRIFRESPNVFMCVSSFNTAAKRLYLRLGYEVVGELKDYVIPGASEFLLRKTIAPLTIFNQRL